MSAATGTRPAAGSRTLRPPSWQRSLRALVVRGLRDNRRAPLSWGGALGGLGALIVALWPSIEDTIDEVITSYPEGIREAFGIAELDSVEKYFDAEMLSLVVPFALAFFAVRCVTRATVVREERGHLDTLLSLPLSRRVLAASTFIVAGVVLAAIIAVVWAMTFVAGVVVGADADAGRLAAGLVNVWPLAMAFGGLAVLAVGALHSSALVTGVTSGTLVTMYVLDLVGRLSDLDWLRYLSAFRWYGSAVQDGLNPVHMLGLTLAGVVLAAVGAVLFERRDVL